MTDAHCHVSGGDPSVREFLIGCDFVGIHPWTSCAPDARPAADVAAWLREQLAANPRLGVGEIGLDRLKTRDISPSMRAVFEAQLRAALEFGRPVVLHGAKCWGQVVAEVKREKEEEVRTTTEGRMSSAFLFHGFSRSDGLLPDIVALNGYVSVGPSVLNDHAVNYRALVKKIPIDRLLVETDRDCEPASLLNPLTGAPLSVRDVLAKTAELRGLSPAELEAITDANATRFMGMGV